MNERANWPVKIRAVTTDGDKSELLPYLGIP